MSACARGANRPNAGSGSLPRRPEFSLYRDWNSITKSGVTPIRAFRARQSRRLTGPWSVNGAVPGPASSPPWTFTDLSSAP